MALLPSHPSQEVVVVSHGALVTAVKLGNQQIAEVGLVTGGSQGLLVMEERLAEGPAATARTALIAYLEVSTSQFLGVF